VKLCSAEVTRGLTTLIALGVLTVTQAMATPNAYQDSRTPTEKRVEDLLGRLTLEEKISLLSGKDSGQTKDIPRLGIPSMKVIDGPHGVGWGNKATCFPSGVSMGACWNPKLMRDIGTALARETRGAERHVLLGPCIGIHRTPLGGRNFESFSEDPYHAGVLGVAYVLGVQKEKIGTSIKHYACNNQEWERTTISTELDERALREIYLPHFKMVVEQADPWTVMAAYNKVRGKYCCANPYLLTDILKDEFGFKGVVVSDWGAVHSTVPSANAGLDLEMPGPGRYFSDDLLKAVQNGDVKEDVIDDKVRRLLRIMFLAGLFDEPDPALQGALNSPEHAKLAQKLAEEAIVLLQNNYDVLPLDVSKLKSIAVIGPNANEYRAGGGSSTVKPENPVTPLAGIQSAVGDKIDVRFAQGCAMPYDLRSVPKEMLTPPDAEPGQHGLKGEYFANKNLEGEPALVRIDDNIDFNWWEGSPAPEIPNDEFSVRWTGTFTPDESGTYELGMTTDDGSRLYIDGKLLIDNWVDQAGITRTAEIALEGGREYELVAEYYENFGAANARLGWIPTSEEMIDDAKQLAAECDAAIVVVGLSSHFEGEGRDRTDIDLPGAQNQLIQEVVEANPKTVVVLINGTPLDLEEWIETVPAVVEAWYPAQEGGHAVANVLFGKVNPSGKLPVTFPKRLEDNPSYEFYPGANGVVDYKEGIYVGYRYYDTMDVEPRFPFGHGLSYTTFEYDNLNIQSSGRDGDLRITVTADIRNTGERAGAEVAQLYVRDVECTVDRPAKELKGFQKIFLRPGEKRTVAFHFGPEALSFYNPDRKDWVAEPGEFEFLIGSSSKDVRLTGTYNHTVD